MNLWVIFLTGLTVGGLTCLAVQGGLLASVITAREEEDEEKGSRTKQSIFPTLSFIIAKLIAYTILGFLLGAFGGAISISSQVQIIMQFIAGFYMVIVALNLLNVHPIFRYAVIQPPRFLTRQIKNQSKSKDLFAPALLGAMTIFIPCGTTLAIEVLAISSGNALLGAAIMGAFILGTSPLFFGVGWLTTTLGKNYHSKFLKIAAIAVIYLGITSINGALVAVGSPLTLRSLAENFPIQIGPGISSAESSSKNLVGTTYINGVQNVDINITSSGYSPTLITVKKGEPVKINLKSSNAYSCASAFRIPSLGIEKNLQPNGTDIVEFTPQNTGKIAFTCSMGMYSGVIEVI